MNRALQSTAAAALMLLAAPASADVKAGVDAWAKADYKTAIDQWRQPAIAGDPDAQFNLGQAYKLGRGVPMDPSIAQGWFRKAAMQNHPQAIDNYALSLFQDGKRADALPWLEKSVARDEKRAELVLGTMLFNGDAVTKDWPRAYALITRSSQQGLSQASQTLSQMDQYLATDDRAKGSALARQYEQQAKFAALSPTLVPNAPGAGLSDTPQPLSGATPLAKPVKTVAAVAKPTPKPTPAAKPQLKVAATKVPDKPAVKQPAAKPAPKTAVATSGGRWRVQLGAFRDASNAQAQWHRIAGRMNGAKPDYIKAGAVTRLQATGYANKAEAARACASAKTGGASCLVVAP